MRYHMPKIWLATAAVFTASAANAYEDLIKLSQNPKEWVMPTGN